MNKEVEKIKFLRIIEISVNKLKDIDHILVLFASFVFVAFLILKYPIKDIFFGFLVGVVLTFGMGYFVFDQLYENLKKLYKEERIKNKDWEKYRNAALQRENKKWQLLSFNNQNDKYE